jgi:hypothetical protein
MAMRREKIKDRREKSENSLLYSKSHTSRRGFSKLQQRKKGREG